MRKKKQIEERQELLNIFAPSSLSFEEANILTDEIIEKGYRKQEWVSVDERLPAESAWYLVNIINHFGLDVVTFTHYTKGYGWGVPDVTHWMPLPEAPKMKGGEQ